MQDRRVIVIGAGPAGLASAAALGRRGIPALVLDRAEGVAASWRGRYDRLKLNSSRPFSKLPGARFPRGTPMFPTRDDMVSYYERYAQRRRIDVRHGVVERIDRDGAGLVVRTEGGDIGAEHVIVATGYAHTPHMPDWPGREDHGARLMHAADYRNASPFRGTDVLVAGSGCSGMEIAYDIAAGGARRVRVAVRTAPNMLLRDAAGPAIALLLTKLPSAIGDRMTRVARRRTIGDLSEYGLPVPEEGVISRLRRLGVAPSIVDEEVVEAIREGRIEIVPGVRAFDETGVELEDGTRTAPDAVIAATGYRTGLEPLVGHLGVLNERGIPLVTDGRPAGPGLRFVGYVPRPAQVGTLGPEARRAARGIARELRGSRLPGLRRPRVTRPSLA